jgi:hypothetical protein
MGKEWKKMFVPQETKQNMVHRHHAMSAALAAAPSPEMG